MARKRSWCFFFFSSRRRHTRFKCDWSSDVCSSDLICTGLAGGRTFGRAGPGTCQRASGHLHGSYRRGGGGRAAGRGRVEISGGAGSLKKKKKEITHRSNGGNELNSRRSRQHRRPNT